MQVVKTTEYESSDEEGSDVGFSRHPDGSTTVVVDMVGAYNGAQHSGRPPPPPRRWDPRWDDTPGAVAGLASVGVAIIASLWMAAAQQVLVVETQARR